MRSIETEGAVGAFALDALGTPRGELIEIVEIAR